MATAEFETLQFLAALAHEQSQAPQAEAGRTVSYKGGHVDRLNRQWRPQHSTADASIRDSWDVLQPRIRDLVRNEPIVKKAKQDLGNLVVGVGIATYAAVLDSIYEYNDEFNFESDEWFERFCEEEADAEGKRSMAGLQRGLIDECIETGNGWLLRCMNADRSRSVPLCYQLLEDEQRDRTKDRPAGNGQNKIVEGIEVDRLNRPVAYHFYVDHPYDGYARSSESRRIPAERMTHYYLPFRPSATSGVSWLTALTQTAHDIDWYLGNEMTAAALGALLTLIIKTDDASAGGLGVDDGSDASDVYGNEKVRMTRGQAAYIGKDDSCEVAESNRPNRDAEPFIRLMMQLEAMGAGIGYLRLTGDMKGASYTAARASDLQDEAFAKPLRNEFGRKACMPMRHEHTRELVALGRLRSCSAAEFNRQPFHWSRLEMQPPGREQLDPEAETDSAGARIRMGLSTHAIECGLRGYSWRKIAMQQRREKAFFKKQGLEFDLSKGASAPKETAKQTSKAKGADSGEEE